METSPDKSMLDWLQNWYEQQCDGDWEHQNGVRIDTLDNPGWSLEVDLEDTGLEQVRVGWTLLERSPTDWIGVRVEQGKFLASGGLA